MNPASAPKLPPYLRRGDVIEWLAALGIEEGVFDKLVSAGTIERIRLAGAKKGFYLRTAIERHIVQPFRDAEERLKS